MEIKQKFEFDAGHRVFLHESKCRNLHGHRYVLWVTLEHSRLDVLGRVLDFSEVKRVLGTWIDAQWDHNTLFHKDDPLGELYATFAKTDEMLKPPYIMPVNPTAENMASHFVDVARGLLDAAGYQWLTIAGVELYETPNCAANVDLRKGSL